MGFLVMVLLLLLLLLLSSSLVYGGGGGGGGGGLGSSLDLGSGVSSWKNPGTEGSALEKRDRPLIGDETSRKEGACCCCNMAAALFVEVQRAGSSMAALGRSGSARLTLRRSDRTKR